LSFGFWVTSVWNFESKKLEIARTWSFEGARNFWDFQGFWVLSVQVVAVANCNGTSKVIRELQIEGIFL